MCLAGNLEIFESVPLMSLVSGLTNKHIPVLIRLSILKLIIKSKKYVASSNVTERAELYLFIRNQNIKSKKLYFSRINN